MEKLLEIKMKFFEKVSVVGFIYLKLYRQKSFLHFVEITH